MKKLTTLLSSLLTAQLIFAQQEASIRMSIAGAPASGQKAVRLSELHADVQVAGISAVTVLDMVFVNDTDRVLEGEFEFPLGAGETVTGYALDINGKMRQGVAVEKEKGRQVFEAVVRQGIDPGLVEMTAGNNFRTRVYPIPAKGSRRVQLTYESEIPASRTYTYSALSNGELDAFSFRISVLSSAAKKTPPASARRLSFDDMDSGYTASMEHKHYRLDAPISFTLPESSFSADGSVFIQDAGKDTYFTFSRRIDGASRSKKSPQKIALFYDVSASMKQRDLDEELALLSAYFATCTPEVTVRTFSSSIHETKTFSAASGKELAAQLAEFLRGQSYDGASCFDLGLASVQADEILLLTDGIANWKGTGISGGGEAPCPVTVINSSPRADHDSLSQYAAQHGGAYVNLCALSASQALPLLTEEQLRIISAECGDGITDIYPLPGSTVTENLSVSGILQRKKADVTLRLGYGSTVSQTVSFTVNAASDMQSERVIRQWAAKKIAALSSDYEANKAEITALAKKHTIVTRGMSLLVLDSVQDYVRYGIDPPEELKEEYERIVSRQNTGKRSGDGGIPQEVYRNFEQFREWWNTSPEEFRKRKNPQKKGSPVRPLGGAVYNDAAPVPDAVMMEAEAMVTEEAPAETSTAAEAGSSNRSVQMRSSSRMMSAAPAAAAAAPGTEQAKGAQASASTTQKIQLQAWNPDADYLVALKRTPTEGMYAAYLKLREQYESSPSFYMDVSDYFAQEGLAEESLRILTNLAELNLENADILRALGNKLVERGLYGLAIPVFERLTQIRGEIPQFRRDLAMAYYYDGQAQKAVDTLYEVASRSWDSRFAEVQQIALNDMNAIIAASGRGRLDTKAIDKQLIQNFDMDVRIVLTWNTDDCDVDLWVTDGDGEKCFYGNKLTANGARISRDFTQGYGPEEFCIRKAPAGGLKIEANYFASHQQKLLQPVTVQAEVYTDFGRLTQKRQVLTLQLDSIKQTFFIGTVQTQGAK